MEARPRSLVLALLLAVGWGASAAIFLTARPEPAPDAVSEEIDEMEHSKRALRDLERIGGKAAVFTSQLNETVGGLFRGRALAGTLAVLTAAVAGAYAALTRPGAAE